jgi:hypothetical protein
MDCLKVELEILLGWIFVENAKVSAAASYRTERSTRTLQRQASPDVSNNMKGGALSFEIIRICRDTLWAVTNLGYVPRVR